MTKLNENLYREVRSDFVQKVRDNPNISDYYKEQIFNASEAKRQMYAYNRAHLQGGDADRKYFELKYPSLTRCIDCHRIAEKIAHNTENQRMGNVDIVQSMAENTLPSLDVRMNTNPDKDFSFASSLGSVEKAMSKKSSSTTLQTKVSARELRQRVKSQCQMHVAVDESLKRLNDSEINDKWLGQRQSTSRNMHIDIPEGITEVRKKNMPTRSELPVSQNHKQLQTDTHQDSTSQKTFYCSDLFRAPIDDVVNSKIIIPMIRKMQRIYINNLKEEMSILEDLERMPSQVNSLYKASFYEIPNIELTRVNEKNNTHI